MTRQYGCSNTGCGDAGRGRSHSGRRQTVKAMSSNSSHLPLFVKCHNSAASNAIYTGYTVVTVLLLPVHVLVLYMGVQRWRRQRSESGRVDIFTYHIAVVEILSTVGSVVYVLGNYAYGRVVMMWGVCLYCTIHPGQTLFHCLTCVEYHLAVVHPIAYRQRERVWAALRHVSVGCVWLTCLGWIWVSMLSFPELAIDQTLWLCGLSAVVVLSCCFSVLHVLTHPGPNKQRVDRSKWRAFHIISTILGVLLLKFVAILICYGFNYVTSIKPEVLCGLLDAGIWMTLPSSLILPLLFLHRERNLSCCWQSTGSR